MSVFFFKIFLISCVCLWLFLEPKRLFFPGKCNCIISFSLFPQNCPTDLGLGIDGNILLIGLGIFAAVKLGLHLYNKHHGSDNTSSDNTSFSGATPPNPNPNGKLPEWAQKLLDLLETTDLSNILPCELVLTIFGTGFSFALIGTARMLYIMEIPACDLLNILQEVYRTAQMSGKVSAENLVFLDKFIAQVDYLNDLSCKKAAIYFFKSAKPMYSSLQIQMELFDWALKNKFYPPQN